MTGEMAQQLSTLATLPEELGSVPNTMWWFTTPITPILQYSMHYSVLCEHHVHIYGAQIYIQIKHSYSKNKIILI